MSLWSFVRAMVSCFALVVAIPSVAFAQAGFVPEGGEYGITGSLMGDQVQPALSLTTNGGYLVWEDNITDGDGQGISGRRVDSSLSGSLSVFRVNTQGGGYQEKPKVVLLNGGGAAFVWQGGPQGAQQIYARFLSSSSTWLTTNDVLVNTYTNGHHLDAAIAKLNNGNVVIVWSSVGEDGSMQGVYGRIFSPLGTAMGGEFQINQTTALNQRTPVVAALGGGRFVVVWVSEIQLSESSYDVSIFARRFETNGTSSDTELRVNTGTNVCANPSVAASPNSGYVVAWGEKDVAVKDNSWDVFARKFSSAGWGGTVQRLNTMQYGDQFAPKITMLGTTYLAVWTSLGQDGSWEGVYGQFLQGDGSLAGGEFRVNTTVVSKQIHPTVAANGNSRFLVLWSSFGGGINSFDLRAQRYVTDSQPLLPPAPPFVTVLSSNALSLTWPVVGGFNVANYEIYADEASTATVIVTNNWWTMTNLPANSTHSFRMAYVLTDGRKSPLSASATNTTYGVLTYGGIPYEWMVQNFGHDLFSWPSPFVDTDGDKASNRDEFLAGTDPNDPNSILRTWPESTPQGMFLHWNTQPGLMYQVQISTNLGPWSNLGGPRFAAGYEDSLYVGGSSGSFYRIVRLR